MVETLVTATETDIEPRPFLPDFPDLEAACGFCPPHPDNVTARAATVIAPINHLSFDIQVLCPFRDGSQTRMPGDFRSNPADRNRENEARSPWHGAAPEGTQHFFARFLSSGRHCLIFREHWRPSHRKQKRPDHPVFSR